MQPLSFNFQNEKKGHYENHRSNRCNALDFDEQTRTVIQHSGVGGVVVGEIVLTWNGKKIVDRKARLVKITPEMPKSTELEAMRKSYLSN